MEHRPTKHCLERALDCTRQMLYGTIPHINIMVCGCDVMEHRPRKHSPERALDCTKQTLYGTMPHTNIMGVVWWNTDLQSTVQRGTRLYQTNALWNDAPYQYNGCVAMEHRPDQCFWTCFPMHQTWLYTTPVHHAAAMLKTSENILLINSVTPKRTFLVQS